MKMDVGHMPTGAHLDSFSGFDWANGVQVDELHALDCLAIHTRNSVYEIVVNDPESGDVLVRGGIYPGFRLELELEGRRILTSPVVSIEVDHPSSEQ